MRGVRRKNGYVTLVNEGLSAEMGGEDARFQVRNELNKTRFWVEIVDGELNISPIESFTD